MKKIKRHLLDLDLAKELFERAVNRLPKFLESAKAEAKNLDLLIHQAMTIVCCGSVVEPSSSHIPRALKLAAQSHAALFASAAISNEAVRVTLGEERAEYSSRPDESTVHVGRWIKGFYVSILAHDNDSLDLLCGVDPDSLRQSATKSPEYNYLYMQALQLWRRGSHEVGHKVIAALQAVNHSEVSDPEWALYLVGHQLEVFMYVVTHDAAFEGGLAKALEHHKKYWSKTEDRKRNPDGFISIALTSLATQAVENGLKFEIESPYLALSLAQ